MRAVRVRAAVWSLIAAAVLVAGCGGSGGNGPTAAPTIGVQAVMGNPTVAAPTTVTDTPTPTEEPAPPATATSAPPATLTPTPAATAIPTSTTTPTPEPPTPTPEPCPGAIPWDQAIGYAGQEITVIGPVVDATWATESRGQPTFLNLGLPYPDPGRFTVLLWIDARWRFDAPPEGTFAGQTVCVTGVVEIYRGGAEIVVEYPWQIIAP